LKPFVIGPTWNLTRRCEKKNTRTKSAMLGLKQAQLPPLTLSARMALSNWYQYLDLKILRLLQGHPPNSSVTVQPRVIAESQIFIIL